MSWCIERSRRHADTANSTRSSEIESLCTFLIEMYGIEVATVEYMYVCIYEHCVYVWECASLYMCYDDDVDDGDIFLYDEESE